MRWIRVRRSAVALLIAVGVLTPAGRAGAAALDDAIASGVAQAAALGVTSYVSVVDRRTGAVVGETANAHQQVASESVMKLFIASYYAVRAGGSDNLTAVRRGQLDRMIRYSDDGIASALFNSEIIPSQAARYGLGETANATNPGRWGAARITAADMAAYLYRMSIDPLVGPWLMGLMAQTTPRGADGFDQSFGFNALGGDHGSKQGWGSDNFTAQRNAVHSVGYTDRYFAAVLQTGGPGTYLVMRDTATTTARLIQGSGWTDPVGTVDSGVLSGFDLALQGWAFDPDRRDQPLRIDIYDQRADGSTVGYGGVTTATGRPDVAAAYPGVGGAQGWAGTVRLVGGGTHRVCAYAINLDAGGNTLLGCVTVSTPMPFGSLDGVVNPAPGVLAVHGWSVEPAAPTASIATHLYRTGPDGTVGLALTADQSRPDVGAAFGGVGDAHGFSAQLGVSAPGVHQVCAYAIGTVPPTTNPRLGCRQVTVANAFGALDEVTGGSGTYRVAGWAINPNGGARDVELHVYDTAAGVSTGAAGYRTGTARPDVAAAFGVGSDQGFRIERAAAPGEHQVCVFAITTGGGTGNTLVGCRTVVVG